jgi:anaerobic ribonucleoside-triphosphate reductase activating protein
LATLVRQIRKVKPQLSVIAFSGFTLGQLRRKARTDPRIREFLNELDVLIDGLYRADLNDDLGLRGSSNQRIYFLTPRYRNRKVEFERRSREIEIHTLEKEMLMVGVPSAKSLKIFQSLPQKIAGHFPS